MANQTEFARQQALVEALLSGRGFPHTEKTVRLVETHISWVLLAGRYAYKIKKALDLGFLNFTSLEARHFYCSEEIRLNRRLAPKIYLDVIELGGKPDAPEFGAHPAIEYAVRMRRFAATKQLDHLLARGKIMPQHMDRLASTLAIFHGGVHRAEENSAFGTPPTIHAAVMQNFAALQSLLTSQVDRDAVTELSLASSVAYAACAGYFSRRRAQGYVRECHGDLHLGNIVLVGEQPIPFDGIEFNPGLRWIDVMDEVAFLVMDLLHEARPDLAFRFLNVYLENTGDYAGVSVLRFYLAYRAAVRAKVSAIRACQANLDQVIKMREWANCRNYLALAAGCLARRSPALIITHGLPGSGKSTFAQAASERIQAIRIRSDVERKRLFGMKPLDDSGSRAGDGIYSADATRRTYARLHELAHDLLEAGFPVIVDAAFLKQEERAQFHALARGMSIPFAIVSMRASAATLHERVVQRRDAENDASEASLDVLQMLQTAQQSLSPYEQARTVEFLNDAEHGGIPAAAPGWGRLNELLAAAEA